MRIRHVDACSSRAGWLEALARERPGPARCPYERALGVCGLRIPDPTEAQRRLFVDLVSRA